MIRYPADPSRRIFPLAQTGFRCERRKSYLHFHMGHRRDGYKSRETRGWWNLSVVLTVPESRRAKSCRYEIDIRSCGTHPEGSCLSDITHTPTALPRVFLIVFFCVLRTDKSRSHSFSISLTRFTVCAMKEKKNKNNLRYTGWLVARYITIFWGFAGATTTTSTTTVKTVTRTTTRKSKPRKIVVLLIVTLNICVGDKDMASGMLRFLINYRKISLLV